MPLFENGTVLVSHHRLAVWLSTMGWVGDTLPPAAPLP